MYRTLRGWLAIAAATLLSGCGLVEGVLAFHGYAPKRLSIETLDGRLRPHDAWFLPEAAVHPGRRPGVLLVPGCAGTQPFHRRWAEFLRDEGFVVLLVDSFAARGRTTLAEIEGACEGAHTWGFERAGDVLVSLRALRAHPRVGDAPLGAIGWSHGGWSVMDAAALAGAGRRPPLLEALPGDALENLGAVVALYPYCEYGSFTGPLGWPEGIPGLLVLAARDENIEPEPCRRLVAEQAAAGRPLEQLTLDVDHWFDNPGGFHIVPHDHDEAATRTVRERVLSRLR